MEPAFGAPAHPAGGILLNSLHFILLAAVSVALVRCFLRGRGRQVVLLVLNLYFLYFFTHGWCSWALLAVLVLGTYAAATLRASPRGSRVPAAVWPALMVAFWALLFMVKAPHLLPKVNPFHYVPAAVVGVSYMVFRCMAVIMDAEVLDRPGLLSLTNFITFFPTLLAGPVESYERFRQFEQGDDLELNQSPLPALHRMVNGYIKKFLLADNLAALGLASGLAPAAGSRPGLWLGTLVLPLVLYLDFSGYCDIMIGLVRLMGFRLAENFDRPWRATNIQEFWNRWHITLSEFIRHYVFSPLWRAALSWARPGWHVPLAVGLSLGTMVLLGLWHAPTWGFLLFGLIHGVLLTAVQMWRRFVQPGLPARLAAWLAASRFVGVTAAGVNYIVVAVTMVVWSQGPARSWLIVRTMFGG